MEKEEKKEEKEEEKEQEGEMEEEQGLKLRAKNRNTTQQCQ